MNRALRRYYAERKKRRVVQYHNYRRWLAEADARTIGMVARTPVLCSCWMCGNPRKYFNQPTIQEQRQ